MKKTITAEMKNLIETMNTAFAAIIALAADIFGVIYYPTSNDWNGKPFKRFTNKRGSGWKFCIWVGPKYRVKFSNGDFNAEKIESCFGSKVAQDTTRNGFWISVSIWDNDHTAFANAMRKIAETGKFEYNGKSIAVKCVDGRLGNLGFSLKGVVVDMPSQNGYIPNLKQIQKEYALFKVETMNDEALEKTIPEIHSENEFKPVIKEYCDAVAAYKKQVEIESNQTSTSESVEDLEDEE